MSISKMLVLFSIVLLFLGCEEKEKKDILQNQSDSSNLLEIWSKEEKVAEFSLGNGIENPKKRWYSKDMILKGKPLYLNNCASCHGVNGQGVILPWNVKMDNGMYPPPPLNDDAHAWHHPLKALRFTIREGGKPIGGVMPSFKDKLSDEDIDNVIAYMQNFWSEPYYKEWLKRGGLEK